MNLRNFSSRLTLAIPKEGKLKAPIMEFLNQRGFDIEEDGEVGILRDRQSNLPPILKIEFVRAADGFVLLEEKVADFAIIGSDIADELTMGEKPTFPPLKRKFDLCVAECSFKVAVPTELIQRFASPANSGELNFALSISTPKEPEPLYAWLRENDVTPAKMLNGLKACTSYRELFSAWLKENGVNLSKIIERKGGVESSIRMGMVDVVADLVDTGSTLIQNNLVPVFDIARTSAVCYTSMDCDMGKEIIINEFLANLKQRVPSSTFEPALVAA